MAGGEMWEVVTPTTTTGKQTSQREMSLAFAVPGMTQSVAFWELWPKEDVDSEPLTFNDVIKYACSVKNLILERIQSLRTHLFTFWYFSDHGSSLLWNFQTGNDSYSRNLRRLTSCGWVGRIKFQHFFELPTHPQSELQRQRILVFHVEGSIINP